MEGGQTIDEKAKVLKKLNQILEEAPMKILAEMERTAGEKRPNSWLSCFNTVLTQMMFAIDEEVETPAVAKELMDEIEKISQKINKFRGQYRQIDEKKRELYPPIEVQRELWGDLGNLLRQG